MNFCARSHVLFNGNFLTKFSPLNNNNNIEQQQLSSLLALVNSTSSQFSRPISGLLVVGIANDYDYHNGLTSRAIIGPFESKESLEKLD